MEKYRAIVVGCGKVGAAWGMDEKIPQPASHAAAFSSNPRTSLVGVVDSDPEILKKVGEYYKVPTFTDMVDCLTTLKPDIVVISTPPPTHEALLKIALDQNIPLILSEKPVSDSLESAERMIDMATHSHSTVLINHQRRFAPLFLQARKKIAEGELGDIQQVSAYYTNGLLNNGTHTVDALHFLLDDTATWVVGVENKKNKTAPFGANIDGVICFSKGTIVTLQSLDNNSYILHDFNVYGTKGAFTVHQYGFRFDWIPVAEVRLPGLRELDWEHATTNVETTPLLVGSAAYAVECLEKKMLSYETLKSGYHTMKVLRALEESAAQDGARIEI